MSHQTSVPTLFTLFLCIAGACTQPGSDPTIAGSDLQDAALSDADEGDAFVATGDAGSDSSTPRLEDAGGESDVGSTEDPWAPLELSEPSLWDEREPCSGTVLAEPATDEPFSVPDNPPSGDFDRTREQFLQRYGALGETWGVIASDALEGHIFPYDLWANAGDEVVLRFFNMGQTAEEREGLRMSLTVLVNYQPVVATYEYLSNADLSEVDETVQSTGTSRRLESDYQVVQITVPGSAFTVGASNEVSLANIEHSPEYSLTYSRRLTVHYGGYGLPEPAPCNPPPLKAYRTYDEYRLRYLMRRARTAIFVDPMPYVRADHTELEARPGETVKVYYSKFHYKKPGFPDPIRVAMIPTMNGEPIGDTIWSMESGDIEENRTGFDIIDDRGTFEVTLPEEPGVYDVSLMTWAYPFVRWRNIDGTPRLGFDGVWVSRIPANSNVLRFSVN